MRPPTAGPPSNRRERAAHDRGVEQPTCAALDGQNVST
jgi:hypothetical protein